MALAANPYFLLFDNHSLNPVLMKVQDYSYFILAGLLIPGWQHIF